jgi:protein-S-isoprenylcysteine O-methyltransferase Ste14
MWRYVPLIAVLLVPAIAFLWRSWLQRRRYGTWGIFVFRSSDRRQHIRDALGVVAFLLLVGQAARAAFDPTAAPLLIGNPTLRSISEVTGAALMLGGLILLVAAQLDLGASWRIGIDERARIGLVTGGLYRFSRNPIFLALFAIAIGYTLMLPTILSLVLLAAVGIGIRQQTLAEERYLTRTYGDQYRDYARRVGRFLPGLGRLQR